MLIKMIIMVFMILIVLSLIDYYVPMNKIYFKVEEKIFSIRENLELNEEVEVYDKEGNQTKEHILNIENKNIIELQETLDNISYCDNINELESVSKNEELFMNDNLFTNNEAFYEYNYQSFYFQDIFQH